MAFIVRIANITNGWETSTVHLGTDFSPYNWQEFLCSLSGGDGDTTDRIYRIFGDRYITSDTQIFIDKASNIIVYSNPDEGYPQPATIYLSGIGVDLNIKSNVDYTELNNLRMQFNETSGNFELTNNNNLANRNITIKDSWMNFNCGRLVVGNWVQGEVINSTLRGSEIYTYSPSLKLGLINTIVDFNDIKCMGLVVDVVGVVASNSVFTNRACGLPYSNVFPTHPDLNSRLSAFNSQFGWLPPEILSADVSTISANTQISYLLSGFNTISASIGDRNYNSTFWNTYARDGVGALYFPYASATLSADGSTISAIFSGAPITFNWTDPFTSLSASQFVLHYGDEFGILITNSATSSTYTYSGDYSRTVFGQVIPKNSWYSSLTNSVLISATPPYSIASFVIEDYNSLEILTSAATNQSLLFSASTPSDTVYMWTWDFDDGTSASYISPDGLTIIPSQQHTYSLGSYYHPRLILNEQGIYSIPFQVISSAREYYVDITVNYDGNIGNIGTSADPFNYSEFVSYTSANGLGQFNDIYRLSGNRDITDSLTVDKNKAFTIRDWDVSAFGPWVISIKALYPSPYGLTNIIFAGAKLLNGIVYNQPFPSYPNTFGGKIYVTDMHDTYVVNQGLTSKILIDPFMVKMDTSSTNSATWYVSGTFSPNTFTGDNKPTWVYLRTYLADYFIDGEVDKHWNTCFKNNALFRAQSLSATGIKGAYTSSTLPDRQYWLSTSGDEPCLQGNFNLEFSMAMGSAEPSPSATPSIKIYDFSAISADGSCGLSADASAERIAVKWNDNSLGAYINGTLVESWSGLTSAYNTAYRVNINRTDNVIQFSAASATNVVSPFTWHSFNYISSGSSAFSGDGALMIGLNHNAIIGILRFQSSSGFPHEMIPISGSLSGGTIDTSGLDITSANFISNSFSNSATDSYWSFDFKDNLVFSSTPLGQTYAYSNVSGLTHQYWLSPPYTSISGDFDVEMNLIILPGYSPQFTWPGLSLYSATINDGTAMRLQEVLSGTTLSDFENKYEIAEIGLAQLGDFSGSNVIYTEFFNLNRQDTSAITPTVWNWLGLRLKRVGSTISFYYKTASEANYSATPWKLYDGATYNVPPTQISATMEYSGPVSIVYEGLFNMGTSYVKAQAGPGEQLPYNIDTFNHWAISAEYYETSSVSAESNLIGSTLYSENGFGDVFVSGVDGGYTSSTSAYNLNIIDAVIVNFVSADSSINPNENRTFIYQSTFSNAQSSVSSCFVVCADYENQYDWIPPIGTNYPFVVDSDLYGKDINYIIRNRKQLKPFDGITIPPNPGYGFSAYPGYETGLFGYLRRNYKL